MVATVKGLDNALNYNINIPSLINPVEGNIMEGVVIKPEFKLYSNRHGKPFYIKKKSEKFKERSESPEPKTVDNAVVGFNHLFKMYINENRLDSVISKNGPIEEPNQIGEYIKLVLADSKEDFLKDFPMFMTMLDSGQQKKAYNVGSLIATMLKGRM